MKELVIQDVCAGFGAYAESYPKKAIYKRNSFLKGGLTVDKLLEYPGLFQSLPKKNKLKRK